MQRFLADVPGEAETPGGPDEDHVLVEQARAGERAAFVALVERHQRQLARYLLHLVGDREVALRLSQGAFGRAYRAVQTTRPGLLVRVWLYRTATSLAYDALRSPRGFVHPPLQTVGARAARESAPSLEERELVRRAVASLTPADRTVLLLCGMERWPYHEVAAVIGTSPAVARQRFARAKSRFRQACADLSGGASRQA